MFFIAIVENFYIELYLNLVLFKKKANKNKFKFKYSKIPHSTI